MPDGREPGEAHRVVVVGGGAGGLELVTRLGRKLGRRGLAHVELIDCKRTHLWKPLLHEIAAGSMDEDIHGLDYMAQARWHGFKYRAGAMTGLDRDRREVHVAPYVDPEGTIVTPARSYRYDTLVLAVGSLTNDFGTPGVKEHAIALETPQQAARFHARLVNALIRASTQTEPLRPEQLRVAIIGAGATGTELAAELHRTTRQLVAFGLDRIDPDRDIRIDLIEAGPRILPALSERLSDAATALLSQLGVAIHTNAKVLEVLEKGVRLADGRSIAAELVVWSAGVKAPDFLAGIGGLETARNNQLVVGPTLQTTRDPAIFALGDCASCAWPAKGGTVPPRAQAAHQQASFLVGQVRRRLADQPMTEWQYHDFGSLVSLGDYSAIGSLMGNLFGGNMFIEGFAARMMYKGLYTSHQLALHGPVKVGLDCWPG